MSNQPRIEQQVAREEYNGSKRRAFVSFIIGMIGLAQSGPLLNILNPDKFAAMDFSKLIPNIIFTAIGAAFSLYAGMQAFKKAPQD